MKPKVILHNAVSLDGRLDWFTPDIGLFYELTGRWREDVTLVGCDTMLEQVDALPPASPNLPQPPDPDDTRPLLAVVDSRGRLRQLHRLRGTPYWREVVALCSRSTPVEHRTYLDDHRIETIVAGAHKVDLAVALEELHNRHGIQTARVDSGGQLNGALLRAGLVDEVSVLVHPALVGGQSPRSLYRAPDLDSAVGVIKLRLADSQTLKDGIVWLRYEVDR